MLQFEPLSKILGKAFIFTTAYFSPIQSLFHVVIIFLAIDWITGIYASYKTKTPIKSNKLRTTIEKFVFYTISIMLAYILQEEILGGWEIANIVAGYIAITELKSIYENIFAITKLDLLKYTYEYIKDYFLNLKKLKKN